MLIAQNFSLITINLAFFIKFTSFYFCFLNFIITSLFCIGFANLCHISIESNLLP